jgi:DNA polymerase-3 subunit delta
MTEAEFKNELKRLNGGYLFFGTEDYLKYSYSKEVQKVLLDGSFDEFNHLVLYAEEYTPYALSDAISSLPVMAEKKLVEVRGVNFNSFKKDDLTKLESVLETLKDNEHTILIIRADSNYFNAGRLPKAPSDLYKSITKHLTPVILDFPAPARLKSWISRHFSKLNIGFDPSLCDKLVEVCGHDMWALSNEITKLCAYANGMDKTSISSQDIDNICCKTTEYDDFQLTNALLERNRALVFETLYRQKSSFEPAPTILASVMRMYTELFLVQRLYSQGQGKSQISAVTGIHEFKVGMYLRSMNGVNPKKYARAVELCAEADIKYKSASNVSPYLVLERLISALCILFC